MSKTPTPTEAREMRPADLETVAIIHRMCFPSSLFSAMDNRVAERYYQMFIDEPVSFAAVLENVESGKVVGFTFGTRQAGIRRRFVKQHFLLFFWNLLKSFLTSKRMWQVLASQMRGDDALPLGEYDSSLREAGVPEPQGPEDLNMGVALDPENRGRGNAGKLFGYYEDEVFKAGAQRVRGAILTKNVPSMKFFERIGYTLTKISDEQVSAWKERKDG